MAEATLYGAIIAGTFALLGVVIERLLRLWGRVRCEASVLSRTLMTTDPRSEDYGKGVSWDSIGATEADIVYCDFAIDLFNGLEVPTALRDIAVVFVCADGTRFVHYPNDPGTGRIAVGTFTVDKLAVLNLPPRQFVHKELRGEFGKDAVDALDTGRWKRIMFEAQRPKRPLLWRKTYRKTIIKREVQ